VTSLEKATGREVSISEAEDHVIRHFTTVFDSCVTGQR
jgi:hypothetical protein